MVEADNRGRVIQLNLIHLVCIPVKIIDKLPSTWLEGYIYVFTFIVLIIINLRLRIINHSRGLDLFGRSPQHTTANGCTPMARTRSFH